LKVWDIIKVPFPYTNRPVIQRRPALVVGQHEGSGSPDLLWVLMITSATHRRWHGDIVIADAAAAGLPAASIVRTAKIATIDAADADALGALPSPQRAEVAQQVRMTLAACCGA
jgi:mRNA interferase MazF